MDVSGSGWSTSGCESGWTLYLDESYVYQRDNSNNVGVHNQHQSFRANSTSYEEDLSMVSDASSGPPHFYHEENDQEEDGYGRSRHHRGKSSKKEKISKKEKKQLNSKQHQQHHHLDDTASSPAISYAKMYDNPGTNQASFMGFPQNFSETQFQGNNTLNNQYDFWHSHPFNVDSPEPSKLRGRRWQ